MDRACKGLIALSLTCGSLAGAFEPAVAQSKTTVPTRTMGQVVDQIMQEAVAAGKVPGGVVGIAQKGKTVLIRAYGVADIEQGTPVVENTAFRIGSVTKQFTAASILLLAERKQLSLDDPLSKYVPRFPRASEVTIRQLLSHTGGVPDYPNNAFMQKDVRIDRSVDEVVDYMAAAHGKYDFEPGTKYDYSNTGYLLLGAVIEKASGMSYAAFLKANIFDPLQMRDTAIDEPGDVVLRRAEGYEPSKTAPGGWVNDRYQSMSMVWSAGALRSTAADLLKWHASLFGGKLLKPESLAAMITPARLKDGRPTEYGLGSKIEQVDGRLQLGHGGGIPGFNAWLRTLPEEDLTIVVLVNSHGSGGDIARRLVPALVAARDR